MWYILILYFVGIFFWNICIKEYDDDDEFEAEMMKDICCPVLYIAASAILGLFF